MKHFTILLLCAAASALQAQRVTLLEYATNTSCTNCAPATKTLDAAIDEIGRSHLAIIHYHTNSPDPSDPFYKEQKSVVDAWVGRTGATSNPTLIVDGLTAAGGSDAWKSQIKGHLNAPVGLTFTITGAFSDRSGAIDVACSRPLQSAERLFVAIVETGIDYPGATNGEFVQTEVFRSIVTGWAGLQPPASGSLHIPFTLGTDSLREPGMPYPWLSDSCSLVVWVQNTSTHAVLNAVEIAVPSLSSSAVRELHPVSSALSLAPNPARSSIEVTTIGAAPDAKIRIVDMLGRTVLVAPAAASTHHMSIQALSPGVYRAVLEHAGAVVASHAFVRQ